MRNERNNAERFPETHIVSKDTAGECDRLFVMTRSNNIIDETVRKSANDIP